jgi:hypothetical protein
VTGGSVVAAALQRNATTAIVNAVTLIIAAYSITLSLRCGEQKSTIRRVNYWQTALISLATLSASFAVADDFKTINGKEYKGASVTRVEPDGIVVKTKSGVSKVYFTELPKDVQERFGPKPAQAATAQPLVQERLHNKPAQPAAAQPKPQQVARANAQARRDHEAHREVYAATTAPDLGFLFPTAVVITIIVGVIIAIVTAVRAKRRRELRARLFDQARDFTDAVQRNRALPCADRHRSEGRRKCLLLNSIDVVRDAGSANLPSRPHRGAGCQRRLYWRDKWPFRKHTTMGGARQRTAHHHKPTVGVCRRERRSDYPTEENCFR